MVSKNTEKGSILRNSLSLPEKASLHSGKWLMSGFSIYRILSRSLMYNKMHPSLYGLMANIECGARTCAGIFQSIYGYFCRIFDGAVGLVY